MYDHLVNVSQKYGIYITELTHLQKWENPGTAYPPMFPYEISNFESEEKYHSAYMSMTLALATKLKKGINFGRMYHTAKMLIHDHATDGYEMLYHLIATMHPRLMSNKALRPQKPKFDGDLHEYIVAYRNWIQFNRHRSPPHIYDHDEIVEDVIDAIKSSRWSDKLKHGLNRVETTLERWKNDTTGSAVFPLELHLEFLMNTILQYYIERNIDPLHPATNTPVARALNADQTRDRSPYRRQYRGRSNSTQRSTQSQRSRTPSETLRDCRICGGRHRESTIGCPNLIRHHQIATFIQNTGEREVQNLVDDAVQERARSQSRDSQRRGRDRSRSSDRGS